MIINRTTDELTNFQFSFLILAEDFINMTCLVNQRWLSFNVLVNAYSFKEVN